MLERISLLARKRMRNESGGCRRDYLLALAQRVELRIMGSKSELPRTLVAVSGARTGGFWRAQFCTEVARRKRLELHEVARRGEPNLPPYRPIKAPESTLLARMR